MYSRDDHFSSQSSFINYRRRRVIIWSKRPAFFHELEKKAIVELKNRPATGDPL